MYRPEGWEAIKQSILEEPNGMDKWCCSVCGDNIVEATADVMLEGLKGEGIRLKSDGNSVIPAFKDYPEIHIQGEPFDKGYLVFIPEEE